MKCETEKIKFIALVIFTFFISCSRTKAPQITIGDITPPSPTLVSISVTPKKATIAVGAKQKFVVTGKFDNQTTKSLTGLKWTFSDNIATVNSSGEVTGSSTGTATITVTAGTFSETVTLTVLPKALQSLSVTTSSVAIPLRQTTQFIATGNFNVGDPQNLTSQVTWSSSNNLVATIDGTGVARGISPGTVTITAITSPLLGSLEGTSSLQVQDIKIQSISVSAHNAGENDLLLPAQITRQFKATGRFSDGSIQDVTSAAAWDSSNTAIASVSAGGLVTGISAGQTDISARLEPVGSNTLTLTVGAALTGILVAPVNKTISMGLSQLFTATGLFDNNTSQDITFQVIWTSSDPSFAAFNDSSVPNRVTTLLPGLTTIQAALLGHSGTTTLTIMQTTLKSISVTPMNPSIAKGTTQQLKAEGTYERTIGTSTDFLTEDITSSVTWQSNTTAVATITNQGLAKADAEGTSTITATLNSVSGATNLIVTPATLSFISVTTESNNYTVFVDGGEQFVATGYFTDGSDQDITDNVYWSVGTPQFASIDNGIDQNKGYATGLSKGDTIIYADFGQKRGTSTLKVTEELVELIRVEPSSRVIAVGTTLQFQAIGILGNGSEQDITSLVTWSSSLSAIASIISTGTSGGFATGISPGDTTIKASFSQNGLPRPTGSTTLKVTGFPLTRIVIAPRGSSIPFGVQQQYTATGFFESGPSQNITSLVTWTTGSSDVATITKTGLATANAIGGTTVTASFGGITDLTPLTVNVATISEILVTPANTSLGVQTSRQYISNAKFNNNSLYDVTSYGTFRSTEAQVAIINKTGFATGISTGTTTIESIFLGMTGSTTLTVKSVGLTKIDVTPQNASVAIGASLSFTATGTFSDNSTQDITNSVSWSTSAFSKATVSNIFGSIGVVTGVGLTDTNGVQITAVFGLKSGSATLKVGGAVPTRLTAGTSHTCVLLTNGQLRCWGKNASGQLGKGDLIKKNSSSPAVVLNVSIAADVASGGSHTCSAFSNGVAQCWGSNKFGQLGIATNLIPDADAPTDVTGILGVEMIATGLSHTCAILDGGAMNCWGANESGQLGIETNNATSTPTDVKDIDGITAMAVEVSTGGSHTCAVVGDGTTITGMVQCWGANGSGQLGIGTFINSNTPINVAVITAKSVTAGGNHTCAILIDRNVKCWGENGLGQLGIGGSGNASMPTDVTGINGVTVMAVAIAAGNNHTCAIVDVGQALGKVQCWGDNSKGQLGNATTTPSNIPVTVDVGNSKAIGISSGGAHTCVLLEGGIAKCWGSNQFGQLGTGERLISTDPVLILGMASSTRIQTGLVHTCAVAMGGTIKCMGNNKSGQLGDGTTASAEQPIDVVGISNASEVTAGNSHTCAIISGTVKCWGENKLGQLGNGTNISTSTPVDTVITGITGTTTASSTSAGAEHVCALLSNGQIWCWGGNSSGQLGNNSANDENDPVLVVNIPSSAKAIDAGGLHTCAVLDVGTVQCWGDNSNGQLGNGQTTSSQVPVAVTGITNVIEVSAGRVHTCAVLSGGTVQCWGDNSKGQLGNGGTIQSSVPVTVSNISTAKSVTTGNDYSCAVLLDGTVKCWGENESGQLGDRTTVNSNQPADSVSLLTTTAVATAVAAGQGHTCVLLSDNTVQCWGDASFGQIGDQVFLIEESPVDVTGL